ncbi:GyrI-like domain-containing protein [Agrilactobacillus yilanensis]|uniref:GyrI-like domain-containing protein n=1 Tax=Agrilactobacillus yilanensis TaxID=2485997 RepID=A0ABW4J804_9LACO|nr:GyrI-like domain-containing protein [Agrilactobacillus yilanensis]
MKYEWRKSEKDLYLPKKVEQRLIPAMNFITLAGTGDPNDAEFSNKISALYATAYSIRMALKKGSLGTPPFEYTVYPLEGVWTTADGSRNETLNKAALVYKIMIRQPDQVTANLFETCRTQVIAKKDNPYFPQLQFESYTDGLAVQAVHTGPFDTEGDTFAKMAAFMTAHQLEKTTLMGDFQHREIYLSNFRRSRPENLKTLLRYTVKSVATTTQN